MRPAVTDRRSKIIDAAERAFARAGFHRTTMHDVALEASMSPGNLYRYFASKEDIVTALAERDRADLGRDFADLAAAIDFAPAFEALARKHLQHEPREKAMLTMELWAEAARNPKLAALCAAFEADIEGHMARILERAAAAGHLNLSVPPLLAARLIRMMADGVFRQRAVGGDGRLDQALDALMAGTALILGFEPAGRVFAIPPADREAMGAPR